MASIDDLVGLGGNLAGVQKTKEELKKQKNEEDFFRGIAGPGYTGTTEDKLNAINKYEQTVRDQYVGAWQDSGDRTIILDGVKNELADKYFIFEPVQIGNDTKHAQRYKAHKQSHDAYKILEEFVQSEGKNVTKETADAITEVVKQGVDEEFENQPFGKHVKQTTRDGYVQMRTEGILRNPELIVNYLNALVGEKKKAFENTFPDGNNRQDSIANYMNQVLDKTVTDEDSAYKTVSQLVRLKASAGN